MGGWVGGCGCLHHGNSVSFCEHWLKLTRVLKSLDLEYRVSNGMTQFVPRHFPLQRLCNPLRARHQMMHLEQVKSERVKLCLSVCACMCACMRMCMLFYCCLAMHCCMSLKLATSLVKTY